MSSSAFSLGNCSTKAIAIPPNSGFLIQNRSSAKSSVKVPAQTQKSIFSSQGPQVNDSTDSFRRRETIGFGICLGLLDSFLQPTTLSTVAVASPCELAVAPSGLAFCDKVVGTGLEAAKGQLIKAHYVGKLENGTVFDSSYNRGKPLTFRIGVGEVIKGWDQGILGGEGIPPMLAGGKRTLKLPPELGYGVRGAGCRGGSCIIPPDSVLLFDVEFIGKA
uniref:peptidylprolyl isomerase n=1 Tax=Melianthus villosus TaxID=377280 RepID=A0A0F7H0F6_9ROSI